MIGKSHFFFIFCFFFFFITFSFLDYWVLHTQNTKKYNKSDETTAVNHSGLITQITSSECDAYSWRRPRSESSADAESGKIQKQINPFYFLTKVFADTNKMRIYYNVLGFRFFVAF